MLKILHYHRTIHITHPAPIPRSRVFSCRLFLVFFTLKNSFSSNLLVIKAGGFRDKNCAKNRQKKLVGFLADVALKMYICRCNWGREERGNQTTASTIPTNHTTQGVSYPCMSAHWWGSPVGRGCWVIHPV